MDETVKTLLLIIGICILLICGVQAQLVVLGIVVLIVFIILLYGFYIGRKEKKQQQRQEYLKNTFPLAYQKFVREHHVRFNYDNWWKSEQLELFFSVKDKEWALMQQDEETIKTQFLEIEKQAPRGLSYWIRKNNYRVSWNMLGNELEQLPVSNINGRKIVRREDVIAAKTQILAYEEAYTRKEAFHKWEEEQRQFSETIRELTRLIIRKGLCITGECTVNYSIPGLAEEDGQNAYFVRHTYFKPFCLDESLDYSLFPRIKNNLECIKKGFSRETDIEGVYEYYSYLFKSLIDTYCGPLFDDTPLADISIVFFDEIENINIDSGLFSIIRDSISNSYENSDYCTVYQLHEVLSHNAPKLKRDIIIIGHVTSSLKLKEQCEQILSLYPDTLPRIYYISIYQELSSSEMRYLIKFKKGRIAAEEEKKRQEQILLDSIPAKVQNWESLWGDLHIKYLIDYYPTTADFEADDEEWENRWLVWNFKNDPDKTSEKDHQNALNRVIPDFVDVLTDTFGKETLRYLTLVCIPASTQEKNEARYKVFSEELCQRTGIENGYGFTQVLRDRTAQHEGGNRNNVNYSFDDSFFNGKRVILFDDIITKGDSMHAAKSKLEAIGAIVICGLAIGKTRHEHRESDE